METRRGPLEYDWRARFNLPLSSVGTEVMTYSEAVRLVRIIRADPSSMLAASIEDWEHPNSREALVLMDLYDLEHAKAGVKKLKPYPRGMKTPREKTRRGNAAGRSPEQILELVRPPV